MKKLLTVLLTLTLLLTLNACGTKLPVEEYTVQTRFYTDDMGRRVEIPEKIERIVPSAAMAQLILQALAPELLVGVASGLKDEAQGFVDERLFALPDFGSLYAGGDLNIEELAKADPQLIVDIGEKKPSTLEDMDALQAQTLIPTVFLSTSLESMPETYRKLGSLLGKEEKAEVLATFCEKVYNRTLSIMDRVGENKVDALYVLGKDGLNVIAANSYHAELIDMLTNNLAVVESPISKGSGNAVTMEQIALWDPDFVIFGPDSIYDTAENRPGWDQITAIINENFVEVPDLPENWMSMPPSVQRYLGLIWLPYVLYPEHCNYDVKADIMEYYRLFYGCELTEKSYAELTDRAFLEG
ncbi:MAG: ABC transporter substrate-binding protein [Oscillospiraceae bacterium]|nr:ABC transporter substrate-binding protein [Oscillospiraceae bacterium]